MLFNPLKNKNTELFQDNEGVGTTSYKDLPFYICLEEDIINSESSKFLNDSFLNSDYDNENNDKVNFFIKVPYDIEAIYQINIDNLEEQNVIYSTYDHHKSPYNNHYITVTDNSKLELLCYCNQDLTASKKAFIFIRSLKKTINSITSIFEPRLYITSLQNGIIRDTETKIQDYDYSDDKPMALIVHGFMSYTEGNFNSLKKELFERKHYGKIFGFTYPSNRVSIQTNAANLYSALKICGLLQEDKTLGKHGDGSSVSLFISSKGNY